MAWLNPGNFVSQQSSFSLNSEINPNNVVTVSVSMKLARKLLSFYLSVIGFIFVFASPSIASAVTQTCGSLYSKENISNKRDRFSEILKEVPEIRSFLLTMIGDPLIPLKIHRILEVSLLQGDISI